VREVLNRSFDARNVPSILARPSGGKPEGVVVFSELDELIRSVLDKVSQLRAATEQADQLDAANWNQAVSTLQQQVDERLDGVRATYAVATQIATLAEARTDLPGLDPTATNWKSWFAVAGDNLGENGIYRFQNGQPVRVTRFTAATSLQTGMRLYDDHLNRYWNISADAVAGAGGVISEVEIVPGFSPDQAAPGDGLERVANRFNVLLDADVLAFDGNRITLSVALRDRIAQLVQSAAEQEALIDSLETSLRNVTDNLAALVVRTDATETAIASHSSQINSLQAADEAILPRVGGLELAVDDLEDDVGSLQSSDAQQQQTINQQGQLIDGLGRRIVSTETTLTGHTEQLGQQRQSIEVLDAAVTDARATILTHGQKLTELDKELDGKLNSADLEAAQEAKLAQLVKTFVLTGGVTERRVDPDDDATYFFTTFTQSTGWNHLHFRQFDLSESLAPYTKRGYSFTFQRVDLDSFRIIFQSSVAAFPDDAVDIALIRIPQVNKPVQIPGWELLNFGWQGELKGTFGEVPLKSVLSRVDNTNDQITLHFNNGAVITRDGWYGLAEEQIRAYIGL
jgi:hypothetical protein